MRQRAHERNAKAADRLAIKRVGAGLAADTVGAEQFLLHRGSLTTRIAHETIIE